MQRAGTAVSKGADQRGDHARRYTAAFALWQATRLVRGSQNNKVPMLTIPGLAAAAYAFWKGHAQLLAVALFIAHVRLRPAVLDKMGRVLAVHETIVPRAYVERRLVRTAKCARLPLRSDRTDRLHLALRWLTPVHVMTRDDTERAVSCNADRGQRSRTARGAHREDQLASVAPSNSTRRPACGRGMVCLTERAAMNAIRIQQNLSRPSSVLVDAVLMRGCRARACNGC